MLPREKVKMTLSVKDERGIPMPANLSLSVVNDQNGQPILSPAAPSNPKIKLPVTRRNFVAGFKKPFEEAARWVSAFFLRFIRIKKGWVVFKEE